MSNFDDVKKLREQTGAGMMDCQKALAEAGGDFSAATDILRKKGIEKAGKKAERTTNEGLVALAKGEGKVAVVVLNCETDFVARNDDFKTAVQNYADRLLGHGVSEFKSWAEDNIKNELIVKIGENIQLGDFGVISGGTLGTYLHSDKKNAAVVALEGGSVELAVDIAMQVVAMRPEYLAPVDVPAEVVEKEKEIYREQLAKENKPAEIMQKIIEGKLQKFYSEVCLLKQPYIKADDQTIEQLLGGIKVGEFKRYSV